MRILCLALAILATTLTLPVLPARAQSPAPLWERVETAPDRFGRFEDIHFATPDSGWIARRGGELWHTGDGGATWTQQVQNQFSVLFRSLGVVDSRTAFAGSLTPGGLLWETRDAGQTWTNITQRISGDQPDGVCGMWVVNEDVIYGVGRYSGSATLIKTTDGGQTWTGTDLAPILSTAIDVYFTDELTGFIVGGTSPDLLDGRAVIIRTTDGGQTWSRVYTSNPGKGVNGEWGWKISFPSDLVGYVSIEHHGSSDFVPSKVLKTVDGGRTWNALTIPGSLTRAGLQGVGFIDENIGWASGRGITSVTTDGGVTWSQLAPWNQQAGTGQLDGDMNRFYVVNDTLAWAVGDGVYRLSGFASSVSAEDIATEFPVTFDMKPVYPNPFSESATLEFELTRPADVRIEVIDILGRTVRTFPSRTYSAGRWSQIWDGRTADGRRVASGSYIFIVDTGNAIESKQVVFLE